MILNLIFTGLLLALFIPERTVKASDDLSSFICTPPEVSVKKLHLSLQRDLATQLQRTALKANETQQALTKAALEAGKIEHMALKQAEQLMAGEFSKSSKKELALATAHLKQSEEHLGIIRTNLARCRPDLLVYKKGKETSSPTSPND